MNKNNVTIKDIANELNISIGTVDRAIHNRGRISSETKEKVLAKVKELGYKPNKVGKFLSLKKKIRIAAIFPLGSGYFFHDIEKGIIAAEKELSDYGLSVEIFSCETNDKQKLLSIINSVLNQNYDAIAIRPRDSLELKDIIDKAYKKKVPVVTFNIDLPSSKRICFIGENSKSSGKLCGEIIGKLLNSKGKVAVLTGYSDVIGQKERVEGFLEEVQTYFDLLEVIGVYDYNGSKDNAYRITSEIIKKNPNIKAIYATSTSGLLGCGECLKELELNKKIKLVGFDLNEMIKQMLIDGTVDASIWQDPYAQGYYSIKILFKYLTENIKIKNKLLYTKQQIILRENINNFYFQNDLYKY